MGGPSQLVGVLLRPDGSGWLVGIREDGRPDLVEGTAAELEQLVLEILAGKFAPRATCGPDEQPAGWLH